MKYNNIIKSSVRQGVVLALMCLALFNLSSCDDFLDRGPLDKISQNNFWKTSTDLDIYVRGLYSANLPGSISRWNIGYFGGDQTSDNMDNAGTYVTFMNGENSTTPAASNTTHWNWSNIRKINMFLDNYQKCEDPFDTYKQYLGEALFLKAVAYHKLVVRYGDVPWYSDVIDLDETDLLEKPRDPRSLVVDSIMNILDQSIGYLKLRGNDATRINKESALVLKSRIALYEASWAKYHAGTPSASDVDANTYYQHAIDAFNTLDQVAGGIEKLIYIAGGVDVAYANLFNRSNYNSVKEVTLARHYDQDLDILNNFTVAVINTDYQGRGYTLDLIQSFLDKSGQSTDITDETVYASKGMQYIQDLADALDPRFKQIIWTNGEILNTSGVGGLTNKTWNASRNSGNATGFSPNKGYNPTFPFKNSIGPYTAGICYRVSEVMLNYVEAYVELNGTFPDLSNNIDVLRSRVGMPALTGNLPTVDASWPSYGYNVSDELAIVRQERRVELAGEGYRAGDWKRWRAHGLFEGKRKKGLKVDPAEYKNAPSVDANGYIDNHAAALPNGYDFNEDRDYLYPIPQQELLRNPNLVQNPGWETPN